MKVKFLSNVNYQTYPETNDMIEVDNELLKRVGVDKQYVNGEIVDYVKEKTTKEKIYELKQFLFNTDYQAIKYAEGQISKDDYEPIKIQRQAWRDEINELEKLLQ